MSKSDPGAAVTLNDTPQEIRDKLQKAFCPKEAQGNPVLEIFRFLVFEHLGAKPLVVRRPEKFGGDLEVPTYADLEGRFGRGEIHPSDLKNEAARRLEDITAPVRNYFAGRPHALDFLRSPPGPA